MQPEKGDIRNPIVILVLTLLTCGFYGMYYYYVLLADINKGLGQEKYSPGLEVALMFITCGLWGYWLNWRIAESVNQIETEWRVPIKMEAPILFLLNVFLGGIFAQVSLNDVWKNGVQPEIPGLGYEKPNLYNEIEYEKEREARYQEELAEFDAQIRGGDNTF